MNKLLIALPIAFVVSAQSVDQLMPHKVKLEQVEYKGKRAIKIMEDGDTPNGEAYAIVKGATFHNGEIAVELAGQPAGGSAAAARGFIGIAFRMKDGQFEYIYLRPTNGRADDQVRRNHSVQYSAHPNFSFAVSRAQAPRNMKVMSTSNRECGRGTASPTKSRRHAYTSWRGTAVSHRE